MNQLQNILLKLGLSANEARVYQQCLLLGQSTPNQIAKKTQIARTTVYDVITDLSLKGFLELSGLETSGQLMVKPKSLEAVSKMIVERKQNLNNLQMALVDVLNVKAGNLVTPSSNNSEGFLNFEKGIEAAKKAFFLEDYEDFPSTRYVITGIMPVDSFTKAEVQKQTISHTPPNYETKELVPNNEWSLQTLKYQQSINPDYLLKREVRILDNPNFESYNRISILGDHVVISTANNNESWGAFIQSVSLAKTLQSIFNLLWLISKPAEISTELKF